MLINTTHTLHKPAEAEAIAAMLTGLTALTNGATAGTAPLTLE